VRKDKAELKDALLQRQRHWFDDESSPEMIGNVGEVVQWTGSKGRVRVAGEIWAAESPLILAEGQKVRVASRSGLDGFGGSRPFSEDTARVIDAEVLRIITESHAEARRLLETHRAALDTLADALLARETLDEQEILTVTGLSRIPAEDNGRAVGLPT